MFRNIFFMILGLSSLMPVFANARDCLGQFQVVQNYDVEARRAAIADTFLMRNISPLDTPPGTVIASPSSDDPDYRYHWVRDAALTWMTAMSRHPQVMEEALAHTRLLQEVAEHNQDLDGERFVGQGEAKFYINTKPVVKWGRPQNDGPALRADAMIAYANSLLTRETIQSVRAHIYDGPLGVIKKDLDYTSQHWREPSIDLWEVNYGLHFYTLRAQRVALLNGADLAEALGDITSARYYRDQASQILPVLKTFWDAKRGYIVPTRNQTYGEVRPSGLDIAVILSALHSSRPGEPFGVTDDRVLLTSLRLTQEFAQMFSVNQLPEFRDLGVAIGRYPEDSYNGHESNAKGNPWFLATNAFAELYFRASQQFAERGNILITSLNKPFFVHLTGLKESAFQVGQALRPSDLLFNKILHSFFAEGDRLLARTYHHMDRSGHMSEQFDRDSGYMKGARDLTWSYASLISALDARAQAKNSLPR